VGALTQHRLGQGEAEKRRCMRRRSFDIAAIRRREIERHAKHVGAADTEDYWRWLVAWVWHNHTSKDQVGALENISEKMGRELGPSEIDEILDQAKATRRRCSADALAKFLGVTYERRQRLRITTIGAIDVSERGRKELRKRQNRRAHERRRRANGVRPRAEYRATSRTACKPWEAAGMSRRTWYRKRAVPLGTSPSAAIPTLTECAENGTSPSAALFLSPADTPVPPERKQGDFREGSCPDGTAQTASPTSLVLENGVLLTRRWIAARERRRRNEKGERGPGCDRRRVGQPVLWPDHNETGLCWLLQGREVVALTETTAAIMNPTSNVTVYRKNNKPALGPEGDSLDDFE
jgi:hypothetical protein